MNRYTCPETIKEQHAVAREVFRVNRGNRARYTCPTCHTENALSAWEHGKGYHCHACTRAAEFGCE